MKKLIYLLLSALALAGCSKGGSDPTPVLAAPSIAGKWEWESESLVTTYKSGQPSATQNKTVVPGSVYLTYGANGYYTVTTNGVTTAPMADTPLVVNVPLTSTNKGFTVTKTLTELTASHMTQVEVDEDNTVKYTTTDTWKR